MNKAIDTFVTSCTLTFKTFEYEVITSKNKANLWHFTATSTGGDKKYAVYCAPDLIKVKSLIKIALKKIPAGTRLIVICMAHSNEEQEAASNDGYTLIGIGTLKKYGNDMLEVLAREAAGEDL
jgi:hypothetical protein